MTERINSTRPAVISESLYQRLTDYCGFRPGFRSGYGDELEWEKREPLVEDYETTFEEVQMEMNEFKKSLKTIDSIGE